MKIINIKKRTETVKLNIANTIEQSPVKGTNSFNRYKLLKQYILSYICVINSVCKKPLIYDTCLFFYDKTNCSNFFILMSYSNLVNLFLVVLLYNHKDPPL